MRKTTVLIFILWAFLGHSQVNHDSIFRAADTITSLFKKTDQVAYAYGKFFLSNKEMSTAIERMSFIADTNSQKNKATIYLGIATIYWGQRKHEEQINYTFKCLKIAENIRDTLLIIRSNYDIGSAYSELRNVVYAKKYFFRAMSFFRETNDREIERYKSNCFNQLGTIYKDQSLTDSALFYHKNALQIRLKLGYKRLIAASYNNLGLVYKKTKDYDNALLYMKKSLEIKKQVNDKKGIAGSSINIGNLLTEKKMFNEAIEYITNGTKLAYEIKDGSFYLNGLDGLANCYFKKGDYKNSALNYSKHKSATDSLRDLGMKKQIAELSAQYESEKKDAELLLKEEKLKNQQGEIKKQKLFTSSVACVLVLVLLLIFFVYRSYRINKKNAFNLERKNIIIEQKNKEITDSINYARRIQNSILTSQSALEKKLPEHFIFYKPKDIVSGDFYWFYPFEENGAAGSLVAVADCTGHGVPGAFMSLIGKEKLDKAASLTTSPGKILSFLNINVKNALQQDSSQFAMDGMDIALVNMESRNDQVWLKYAGANRPLWIVRKDSDQIEEIKATKQAIAGFTEETQEFTEHTVILNKGDTFYLFTDGYADQFGGEKKKKLTTRTFRQLLLSHTKKTMKDQKQHLYEFLNGWMTGQEQMDDILVIGIRV